MFVSRNSTLTRTPVPGLTEAGKVLKVVETIYEKSGIPA